MTSPANMPTERLSDERLREVLAATEGVTPGPWYQTGAPWFRDGTGILAGSPDGNVAYLIADTDDFALPRDEYEGFPLGDKEADARHIANCDPQTIAALVTEVLAARETDAWQPIETAPKDGTNIILYAEGVRDYARQQIGHWGRPLIGPACWFNSAGLSRLLIEPTHWRLLPTPPVLKETPTNAA